LDFLDSFNVGRLFDSSYISEEELEDWRNLTVMKKARCKLIETVKRLDDFRPSYF
jgi:hypothetical protein